MAVIFCYSSYFVWHTPVLLFLYKKSDSMFFLYFIMADFLRTAVFVVNCMCVPYCHVQFLRSVLLAVKY